ncbi:MFS transporter [Streptomyces sp. NPDC005438]|uniref:MFS transporter n=1 Tax=Streptomyces sp. NPDC005438 TaxID=3156880 RepID=UPI0033A3AE29
MPHPTPPPTDKATTPHGTLGGPFVLRLGIANLGLFAALMTPVILTMTLRVEQVTPHDRERTLGLVLGVGAVVALLANPLAGRLSDRSRSRHGRRRPYLVGGALLGGLGLLVVTLAPNTPTLLAGWCLAQVGYNCAFAALLATIPDQVPRDDRGKASAAVGVSMTLGVTLAVLFAGAVPVPVGLLAPALLALATLGLFAHRLPDQVPDDDPGPFSARAFLGGLAFHPRRHPDFGWAWLTKFLVLLGGTAPLTYIALYVPHQLDTTASEAAGTVSLLLAASALVNASSAALGGWISDRLRRRKPLVIAGGLTIATGLATLIGADALPGLILAQLVLGIGAGLFGAVDTAMITEVLPDPDNPAKDLGVVNIANALPQSVMPLMAPVLLSVGTHPNYALLFGTSAACALLGSVLVTRIRTAR